MPFHRSHYAFYRSLHHNKLIFRTVNNLAKVKCRAVTVSKSCSSLYVTLSMTHTESCVSQKEACLNGN